MACESVLLLVVFAKLALHDSSIEALHMWEDIVVRG
jgi:hypothetical protein